jgi:transcriptional regulator with XRE-family HTH domain
MSDTPTSGKEPPREPTQADRAQLATRLLAALYDRYWTQGDLAWEAGLRASKVARYCHGTEWPDADSLARLAAALGLPLGGLDPAPDPQGGQHKGRARKTGKILSFGKRRR